MSAPRIYNHRLCNALIIVVAIIIVVATKIEAFTNIRCATTHHHHQIIDGVGHHHCQLSATAKSNRDEASSRSQTTNRKDSGSNSNKSSSIFGQPFNLQFPWDSDTNNNSDASTSSLSKLQQQQQQQWWPINNNSTVTTTSDFDKYVQSAQDAISIQSIINNDQQQKWPSPAQRTSKTLGILLIDHGSKRSASNEHLLKIANLYQTTISDKIGDAIANYSPSSFGCETDGSSSSSSSKDEQNKSIKVVVRAAHMEIAKPSILQQLTSLIEIDEATNIICVPYFLSPGKHAIKDVPKLVNEAREILDGEGMLDYEYIISNVPLKDDDKDRDRSNGEMKRVQIHLSKALGTNVNSMLHVVDELVGRTLLNVVDDNDDVMMFRKLFETSLRDGSINWDTDDANESAIRELEKEVFKYKNRVILLEDALQRINQDKSSRNNINVAKMNELEAEITKYSNRAALLETVLEAKVNDLQTMTNRATLLEDAMGKLQSTRKKEKDDFATKSKEQELLYIEQVANLTSTIDTVNAEKAKLVSHIESMTLQQTALREEYDTTVAELKSRLVLLEREKDELQDENQMRDGAQQQRNETQLSLLDTREAELNETIQQQQGKIQQLQTQLFELLDAHNKLEELQADTETKLHQLKQQLKEAHDAHAAALDNERQETETYRTKFEKLVAEVKEEGERILVDQVDIIKEANPDMLADMEKNYEKMLDEEPSKVAEWKEKWRTLHNATTNTSNSTDTSAAADTIRAEEEWTSLQQELESVTKANKDALSKVKELEMQLQEQQQKEQDETSKAQKEVEQQQKLQEYLQAQLSTYYETIEAQKTQIYDYDEKIIQLEKSHNESMLIANNSVEASQRREDALLTSVEELEEDLAAVKQEKDTAENEMTVLQTRLDKMEQDREALKKNQQQTTSSSDRLVKDNEELSMQIKHLEYRVQEITLEKDQLQLEKRKIEMGLDYDGLSSDSDDVHKELAGEKKELKEQQLRRHRRRWYKPWTLFRRYKKD